MRKKLNIKDYNSISSKADNQLLHDKEKLRKRKKINYGRIAILHNHLFDIFVHSMSLCCTNHETAVL